MVLASGVEGAQAEDANPNDPALFIPAPTSEQSLLQAIGPGQGPRRAHSDKADVHKGVSGYSPARRCLSCHEGQQNNLHYARTTLRCRDCHISDPIAGIRNPKATMFAEHRAEKVCARCHEGAGPGMASYVIHEQAPWSAAIQADFPALYWSTFVMLLLAGTVFLIFLPYTGIWALREIGHRWRHRREPKAASESVLVERFSAPERIFHTLLVVCFMALSVTGVAWMYIETGLGGALATPFGGYEGTIFVHRAFGVILMAAFALHILYLIRSVLRKGNRELTGPDSLVWTWADFRAFHAHLKWLVGLGGHPVFDRWTWWQKFDYWAVWWGLVIVGSTGILLFDPVLTAEFLPGWTMNVARWVHKVEAVLAMGHIFIVHFFIESYRPSAFPLNDHVFHGAARLEDLEREHPAWIARLEADGNLSDRMTAQPPKLVQAAFFSFGFSMVLLGLALLAAMAVYAVDLSL
ncbi:cytochrome b/b6 domain-containing protein [Magnetospira sp. QH-2]|uniref:cytochrome b/b6 domain-containing protein n=1 Tax=Magnetospira sp. (strain QH-2) TaxID=1288970 RepID=UPI0003E81157|nr:cytochrome b/b6 domain-containing protein [Magnetospira sp. QH-2]CCQ72488.1 Membrane protein of unknown function; putative membrane tri-heme c-type cytochrome [Magnetospira sp. QH-2]